MIAVKVARKRYTRERSARDEVQSFLSFGGSIVRRGASREFDVIAATVRRPDRLDSVLRLLTRQRPDLTYDVIDWTGLDDDGLVYTVVTIAEAIELSRSADYVKEPAREAVADPQDNEDEFRAFA